MTPAKNKAELTITCDFDRETTGTRRYKEVVEDEDARPHVGTVYVRKTTLKSVLGNATPDSIEVTVRAK